MDPRKDTLKKSIMALEWDKRHGQLNAGRKILLDNYIKELSLLEAENG